jgi:hypothetical protein
MMHHHVARMPHAASRNAWLIAAHPSMATDAAKIMRRAGPEPSGATKPAVPRAASILPECP